MEPICTLLPFDDDPMRVVLAVAIAVFGIVFVVAWKWYRNIPPGIAMYPGIS